MDYLEQEKKQAQQSPWLGLGNSCLESINIVIGWAFCNPMRKSTGAHKGNALRSCLYKKIILDIKHSVLPLLAVERL